MIEKYLLKLNVDFKNLTYKGTEVVTGDFSRGESLDFDGLEIEDVSADTDVEYSIDNGKLSIKTQDTREVRIHFKGKISEKSLMGMHKSIYDGGYIITTQMEPTGARSVFPCIDNPASKAVFKLDVQVNEDVEVISNTLPEFVERGGNHAHYIFRDSPRMSTYLIYLGIGKFERISEEHNGRKLSVVTTPGKSKQGEFALKLLEKVMDQYEEYYEIKYPLEKMDLIAIPQFGAGAMENWGAITFREIALLLNESVSFSFKKEIGKTLSHEMAHQWFGNLVTMEWWDDLWLNESFATFVGNKILDRLEKGWHLWEEFLVESTLPSMRNDGLLNTHPIRVPVHDPSEIAEIFDSISYGKGASILRMIEHFLGEDKFRKGVISYLKEHSYGNAKGEDLWNSLARASEKDVDRIMKTWLEKEGYPYLTVKRENGSVRVTQQRFSYLKNNDHFIWSIPIFYKTENGERAILMESNEIILPEDADIIVNPSGVGYYRVMYSADILEELFNREAEPTFMTRLIDDSYSFLLASKIDLKTFMKYLEYVKDSNEYILVNRIIDILLSLDTVLDSDKLQDFSRRYLNRKLEYFKSSSDENSLVIVEKIYSFLPIVDASFRKALARKYIEYEKAGPEERTGILISAAIENFEVDRIIDEINHPENDMELVKRMALALPRLKDIDKIIGFLDIAKNRPDLRGNLLYTLVYSTRNRELRSRLWDWTEMNFDDIYNIYRGSGSISFFVEDLIAFAGIGNREKVESFLSKYKIPEAQRAINNGKEYLEIYERLIREA